jgi:glycosyltransferase involved in cell wall biosynthesis
MSDNLHSGKKIVVLHLIVGLSTGGAEIMLYNLLNKINRWRFQPVVVSLTDRGTLGDRITALGIPVYTLDMKIGSLPTPRVIWRLIQIIRKVQPDIIQGWMYHGNLAAQLGSIISLSQIPVIWSIHHSINSLATEKKLSQIIIRFCSLISRFASKIVFVSSQSQRHHQAIGYSRHNSCIIPNGFDTSLFKPSNEARISVRKELGLSPASFLIGSFARFHPMKDHANLLQAAALLVKEFPEVHFVLAGSEVEPKNQILSQQLSDLNLVEQVHLLGERRDIHRLIASIDILTSSSAYGEAFPLVIGEAMSSGIPCAVTDIGDSSSIVHNTGKIVPPRHPQALANAWKDLIQIGSEHRQTLGQAARTRIIEFFSLDSIVNCYEDLYDSVLEQKQTVKNYKATAFLPK